jgi:hypothetical protein
VHETVLFVLLSLILLVVPIVGISYAVIRAGRWVDARDERRRAAHKATQDQAVAMGLRQDERTMLKPCSNRDVFALTLPYQDDWGRTSCSETCRDYVAAGRPGFCRRCISETADREYSTRVSDIGLGWNFGRGSDECPQCHSEVRTLWLKVLLVPVIPLARCRTIKTSPYHYRNRRVA